MKFCITCKGSVYDDHQECTKCLKIRFPVIAEPEKEPEVKVPEVKPKKKGK
jgi:hypothetical protein